MLPGQSAQPCACCYTPSVCGPARAERQLRPSCVQGRALRRACRYTSQIVSIACPKPWLRPSCVQGRTHTSCLQLEEFFQHACTRRAATPPVVCPGQSACSGHALHLNLYKLPSGSVAATESQLRPSCIQGRGRALCFRPHLSGVITPCKQLFSGPASPPASCRCAHHVSKALQALRLGLVEGARSSSMLL